MEDLEQRRKSGKHHREEDYSIGYVVEMSDGTVSAKIYGLV